MHNLFISSAKDTMIHITYHPLKGHAQNSTPPQFNNRFATAGSAYHLRPKSENHLYLKITNMLKVRKMKNWYCIYFSLRIIVWIRLLLWWTYSGCEKFTSKIKSSGISNICGSSPFACKIRGRTSNMPFLHFQPKFLQTFLNYRNS